MRLKCDVCGKVIIANSVIEAEQKWSMHECPDSIVRNLPFDLLRQVAYGEITEGQAWDIVEERKIAMGELR